MPYSKISVNVKDLIGVSVLNSLIKEIKIYIQYQNQRNTAKAYSQVILGF